MKKLMTVVLMAAIIGAGLSVRSIAEGVNGGIEIVRPVQTQADVESDNTRVIPTVWTPEPFPTYPPQDDDGGEKCTPFYDKQCAGDGRVSIP